MRQPRGFTLIELLGAVVLAGIGLSAILALLGHAGQQAARDVEREVAIRVAQEHVEVVLGQRRAPYGPGNFGALALTGPAPVPVLVTVPPGTGGLPARQLWRRTVVAQYVELPASAVCPAVPLPPNPRCKRVTVSVDRVNAPSFTNAAIAPLARLDFITTQY